MRSVTLLSSVLFGLATAACSGSESRPSSNITAPTSARSDLARTPVSEISAAMLQGAVDADNAFAFAMYDEVRRSSEDPNVVLSPLSVSLALSMTYTGAQNTTASEIAAALGFSEGPDFHEGQNALSQQLASRAAEALSAAKRDAEEAGNAAPSADDYRLHIVNSIWGEQTYTWETPFLDTLAKSYGAGVYVADFLEQPDAERERINAWVSDETQGKIGDLLPPATIDGDTRLVLVNAVHLKMPWAKPFDAESTKPGTFTRPDGSTVTADFMAKHQSLAYFEDEHVQLASLPLAGGDVSVTVVLPKAGLSAFEDSLDAATWKSAWEARRSEYVALSLPKFSFTSASISLESAFQRLGMVQAFDPKTADFYGMCSEPPRGERLFVSDIVHKAMMAIDEDGVEAAAATAVAMAGMTSAPPEPVAMVVDQPFMVAIVDEPTGAVLFLGHIQDPTVEAGR